MINNTHNDGEVLGMGSVVWAWLSLLTFIFLLGAANFVTLLLLVIALWGLILAVFRGRQAEKEQEGHKEIQKLLSSPDPPSKLTADPALYRRAQAELQARKENALKMQELHALRQQVEERKSGIFAPTLSPTRSQSGSSHPQQTDLMALEMARLAQRRIKAERQKHMMKSLRAVEDAEWEADDV